MKLDQQIGRHLNYLGSRVPPWHVVLPVSTTPDLQRQRCVPDQRPGFQMKAECQGRRLHLNFAHKFLSSNCQFLEMVLAESSLYSCFGNTE